jgi:hypothetical protein
MSSDPPASSGIPAYSDWSHSPSWPAEPADVPATSSDVRAESIDVQADPTDVPATSPDLPAEPTDVPPAVPDGPVLGVPEASVPEASVPEASVAEAGRPRGRGWRFLVSPKWLGWHALMIIVVLGMLALGDWQLRRAEAGNALSWAYTFEWPIFAGFAVVFWAKTIRDEFRPPARAQSSPSPDVRLPGGVTAVSSRTEAEEDEDEDEELAEYNAYLARLTTEVRGHGKWHGLR